MTDREIQEQLLAHYKKHYILLPLGDGVEAAKRYCADNHIYYGVCSCIEKLFGITYDKASQRYTFHPRPCWITLYERDGWWGRPPLICHSVQEIRSALRLRIDILCKILGLPLNCCFYDEEGV